jgi:hypothetical protein
VARFDFAQVVAGSMVASRPIAHHAMDVADALAGRSLTALVTAPGRRPLAYQFGHGGSLAGIGFDATSDLACELGARVITAIVGGGLPAAALTGSLPGARCGRSGSSRRRRMRDVRKCVG